MDFIMSYPKGRDYIIKQVKGKVMSQTQGNYPAPLEIIDVSTTYCFSQIKTWQHIFSPGLIPLWTMG